MYASPCLRRIPDPLAHATGCVHSLQLRKRDGANTNVQGTELMNAICTYPEWKHYHENLYWGCAKIQAEFQGDVFGTFNGKHTFGDDEEIYSHKKRVRPGYCVDSDGVRAPPWLPQAHSGSNRCAATSGRASPWEWSPARCRRRRNAAHAVRLRWTSSTCWIVSVITRTRSA